MRPHARILLFASFLAAGLIAAPRASSADVSVRITVFQSELAPYGRWVTAGRYGRCWAPSGVVAGWEPYVDGEWVWTDYGWTWISSDPWGDVVYHYGTWVWVDDYGWVWVPGTVWAPAWVTWAYTDDYIGWAPVPYSFALSAGGYRGSPVVVSSTRYVFVPTTQFVGTNVASVRVAAPQAAAIFPRATKVTRFDVSGGIVHTAGPTPARIERVIGRPIPRASIERMRAKPTTLAAGGFGRGRAAIVAPAPERARVVAAGPPEGRGRGHGGAVAAGPAGPARVERAERHPSGPPPKPNAHVERKERVRAAEPAPRVHTERSAGAPREAGPPHEKGGPPHEKGGPPPEHGRARSEGHAAAGGPPPGPPPQAGGPPPQASGPPPERPAGHPQGPPPGQVQKEKEKGPPPGHGNEKKKDQ